MTIHMTSPAQQGLAKARRSAERYRAEIIDELGNPPNADEYRLLQAVNAECDRLGRLAGTTDRHIATCLGLPPVDGEEPTPMDRLDPSSDWLLNRENEAPPYVPWSTID